MTVDDRAFARVRRERDALRARLDSAQGFAYLAGVTSFVLAVLLLA